MGMSILRYRRGLFLVGEERVLLRGADQGRLGNLPLIESSRRFDGPGCLNRQSTDRPAWKFSATDKLREWLLPARRGAHETEQIQ
jgi:hypothetical protein